MEKRYAAWLPHDPTFEEGWTYEAWQSNQIERLWDHIWTGYFASQVPARLNTEADRYKTLAADKKFSKRYYQNILDMLQRLYDQAETRTELREYLSLEANPNNPDFDLEQERSRGAQVDWPQYLQTHFEQARAQAQEAAAQLHLRQNGKLANKAIHKIQMEIAILSGIWNKVHPGREQEIMPQTLQKSSKNTPEPTKNQKKSA